MEVSKCSNYPTFIELKKQKDQKATTNEPKPTTQGPKKLQQMDPNIYNEQTKSYNKQTNFYLDFTSGVPIIRNID